MRLSSFLSKLELRPKLLVAVLVVAFGRFAKGPLDDPLKSFGLLERLELPAAD